MINGQVIPAKEFEGQFWIPANIYQAAVKHAVEAEREACIQLIERTNLSGLKYEPDIQLLLAAILNAHVRAIRARGQQ